MNQEQTAAALRAAGDQLKAVAEVIEQWGPSMRWEYRVLPKQGEPIRPDELNELGREGWRLVTILEWGSAGRPLWIAYLMRPEQV